MQGSSNPLILRNYRVIPPQNWKYFNLHKDSSAYMGQHIPDRPIKLVFKVEAAPVVLPYESELILKFSFLASPDEPLQKYVSNQWTPNPRYRIKAKSMAHIIERCWMTISNMTFQSVKPPYYLNEILLRKPAPTQMKYPDNYTGEKIAYLSTNTGNEGAEDKYLNIQNAGLTANIAAGASIGYNTYLEPLSRSCPNEGQLYFMTPQIVQKKKTVSGTIYNENTLTFRIPFTELLPVFKVGVIPLIMIAANSFDLLVNLYKPADWFVDCGIGEVAALETWLNVTTVSFPDINPLAEMLIRPRSYDGRFIAPYLDYFTFEKTYVLTQPTTVWYFNIIQSLRNVPFISISFSDQTEYPQPIAAVAPAAAGANNANAAQNNPQPVPHYPTPAVNALDDTSLYANNITFNAANKYFVTGDPGLTAMDKDALERGGFFSLPPDVRCEDVKIMLGESTFPLTQFPINWDDMYMYNRKHFEMYGRDFNVYRVSPIGRAYSGDGTFFFDLSHSPMTGFSINSGSPLQIVGSLISESLFSKAIRPVIKITVTAYYTNNFNTMLASGGVVPLQ